MRHSFVTAILVGLFSLALCSARDGIIHNDLVWRDSAGKEIWCNGGHIIREGDLFWWVGYDRFPNVTVRVGYPYTNVDLVLNATSLGLKEP